jgi:hypothetical protein
MDAIARDFYILCCAQYTPLAVLTVCAFCGNCTLLARPEASAQNRISI